MKPEVILLIGSFLWLGAALAVGLPRGLVPSEIPFIFCLAAVIGGLFGISGFLPRNIDVWLSFFAAVVYLVAPIGLSAWFLYMHAPEDRDPGDPKTIT